MPFCLEALSDGNRPPCSSAYRLPSVPSDTFSSSFDKHM